LSCNSWPTSLIRFINRNIIIVIIRYQSGLDRPVFTLQSSFKPSSFIWSIIQHFILHPVVVHSCPCHSEFDLYLLSFSSTGSTFNFSRISSFLLWSKKEYLKMFTSINVSLFLLSFFFWGSRFCFHIKECGKPALYTFILENFWTKIGLKMLFRFSSIS